MSPPADTHPSRGTRERERQVGYFRSRQSLYTFVLPVLYSLSLERSLSSTRLSLCSAPRWRFRVGKDFWLAVDCVLHLYPSLLLLLRLGWLVLLFLSAPLHVDDDEEDQLFLRGGSGNTTFECVCVSLSLVGRVYLIPLRW